MGRKDPGVWRYAHQDNLTITTMDGVDMKAMQLRHGHPPKIIILTLGNSRVAHIRSY
ncbi:DUF5615 family PIN-like protein [Microbulbifer sp. ZKSA002]|uniref:DUF5615 family PIN-like protein n=1 Tax=Microbulbifer sp. ZKSA002 TaxID=3243388 RepID=UPI0040392D61